MKNDDAIVNPFKGKSCPNLGPVAIMVSSEIDLKLLGNLMSPNENNYTNMFMSRLYVDKSNVNCSLVGPIIGAPYAVLVMENLIAWGAREILFLGLCGAISKKVRTGDIILPTGSLIDEGTSPHYNGQWFYGKKKGSSVSEDTGSMARPSENSIKKIRAALVKNCLPFHEGAVWTTDAIFRETREKVEYFRDKNALAVEMEASALFTVGKFRGVETGSILVVSDELSTFKWKPGFKEKRFKESCAAVCELVSNLYRH